MIPDRRLTAFLVKAERLTQEQYKQADRHRRDHSCSLSQSLDALDIISQDETLGLISQQMGRPVIDLERLEPSRDAISLVPVELCRENCLLPVALIGDTLSVVMDDPFDIQVMETLEQGQNCRILPFLARDDQIRELIDRVHPQHVEPQLIDVSELIQQEYAAVPEPEQTVEVSENVTEESAPIIQLSEQIIEDAFKKRASDIHIEPFENESIVRFRVDSVLERVMSLPPAATRALVSRLKIMSNLSITEKRQPQDGRITFKDFSRRGTNLDLRVSTLPVTGGEKVVMRLIDREGSLVGLDAMGFSDYNLAAYRKQIVQPYGMVLHVGPTGSGKTTTLYGALAEINRPEINITTAEDPVEYTLDGINQSQMQPGIDYTFAKALRSFLRQDPDVILVGEVRDLETAKIAVEAALTGHLLFSTLHTNDAVGTVTRLVEMGIEPFLVASSLLCICAQRLLRKLCVCAQTRPTDKGERKILSLLGDELPDELLVATGCTVCSGSGYRGRIGTHELLTLNPELKQCITRSAPESEIQAAAEAAGMITLRKDALSKVVAGITTLEESLRVVRID